MQFFVIIEFIFVIFATKLGKMSKNTKNRDFFVISTCFYAIFFQFFEDYSSNYH